MADGIELRADRLHGRLLDGMRLEVRQGDRVVVFDLMATQAARRPVFRRFIDIPRIGRREIED